MKKDMKRRKMFDLSTIPNDLCPVATDFIVMDTGSWRSERPVVLRSKCVKCGICWAYCPVQCILEKPTWFEADLRFCKGCGICAKECPNNAVMMIEERE